MVFSLHISHNCKEKSKHHQLRITKTGIISYYKKYHETNLKRDFY